MRKFGIFTRQEYRKLLAALHPDSVLTPERKREVFQMVTAHEKELCTEREKPLSDAIPKTMAELLARRDEVRRRRAVARALKKTEARKAASPPKAIA